MTKTKSQKHKTINSTVQSVHGYWGVLQGRGAGSSSIRFGDVGDDPPHRKGPGKFPAQVCQVDYREADKVMGGW